MGNARFSDDFKQDAPDRFWVADITYIKTYEGFLYLVVVIDLYSRRVVGWATHSRQYTDLVLQALLMAVWRRKPTDRVLIHSDQGSQFTSLEWLDQNIFETIAEAQEQATKLLWTYSNDRPNIGIGGITPAMKLKMAA